ncbi:MAG: hypothetical protein H7306_11790 [Bacteriovorax sp.]|nr:hypothetical protein [Rhizobacter sp.]
MEIRALHPPETEAARSLLVADGWDRRVSVAEAFRVLLSRSQRALVAVVRGRIVAFLRALTDGMSNGTSRCSWWRRHTAAGASAARWCAPRWVMTPH